MLWINFVKARKGTLYNCKEDAQSFAKAYY
jgi:hypothetical protein